MAESRPRQNYHQDCEAGINKQINMELHASYVYQSMAFYFDRDDVALPGFSKFFSHSSAEERVHAEKLMKYQNKRGGRVVLQSIQKPDRDEWGSGLDAMKTALQLEKTVNQALIDLHNVASKHVDPQLSDYIEEEFLNEQVDEIKKLSDHVTTLTRIGTGHGEWHFDQQLKNAEEGGSH